MKFKFTKKIALLLSTVLTISILPYTNAGAFVTGYNNASVLTNQATAYITNSTQNDWYKFTLTSEQVPMPYSIVLQIPNSCVYNFDLRYREEASNSRPKVLSNETFVTATRRRGMHGVLTEPGTYYIRVYSQDNSTDSENYYKITLSTTRDNTKSLSYSYTDFQKNDVTDWCVCADLAGNNVYKKHIANSSSSRNYKNAYGFIATDKLSDSASEYDGDELIKATPDETAEAADYIYSGDTLINKKFEVENNKIYTIEDLMMYTWQYKQPVILSLSHSLYPTDLYQNKYIIIEGVNIGNNTINYYNPSSNNVITVDYDDFLISGMTWARRQYNYTGTNIVQSNYREEKQTAFN